MSAAGLADTLDVGEVGGGPETTQQATQQPAMAPSIEQRFAAPPRQTGMRTATTPAATAGSSMARRDGGMLRREAAPPPAEPATPAPGSLRSLRDKLMSKPAPR